ncbi:MAG TPA: hypothetical protein EYP54_00945 [Anaerolineales bacterium]|nr:hypothetical protein [Anaerolineales bacterium]
MGAGDDPPMQAIRLGPTHLPGALTRCEVVQHYIADTDLTLDEMRFYCVYGLFRLADIAQQIYYRYYHGQTQDERLRHFGQVVAGMEVPSTGPWTGGGCRGVGASSRYVIRSLWRQVVAWLGAISCRAPFGRLRAGPSQGWYKRGGQGATLQSPPLVLPPRREEGKVSIE